MDIEQNDLSVGFQTFNRQQIRAAIPDIINEFANSVQAMLMRTSISVEMAFVHSISQKISIVDVNTYNKDIENRARNITIWRYNSTLQPMKLIIFTKKKAKGKRVKWVKPSNGKGVHTNQHALWSPRLTWRKAVHTYQDAELESTMEFNKHKLVTLEAEVTNKGVLALYGRLSFIRAKRLLRYYLNGVDAFRLKLLFPHHGSIMKSKAPSKDKETQAHASSKALGEGVYRILRHKHKNDKKMQTRLIFKL